MHSLNTVSSPLLELPELTPDLPPSGSKIVVALSGGVDSSVATWLLLNYGYRVEGLFMKNWEEDDRADYCAAAADLADAQAVCDQLGIPLHTANFATEYWDQVFEHFLKGYRDGLTPNPDILCNKEIKFKELLNFARQRLGADYIATGHYVRRRLVNGAYQLMRAVDQRKDQSYFLYSLDQSQIAAAIFPLGSLEKKRVRQIALQTGLITASKRESMGICFIGHRRFREFLSRYLPMKTGQIRSVDGDLLGEHPGVFFFTLGQRKGIGIGGTRVGQNQPWYVVAKDLEHNVLVVAQGHDHPLLHSAALIAEHPHWIAPIAPTAPLACMAKLRHQQREVDCHVANSNSGEIKISFPEPQRAATPGQSAVFYQGEICLGGAVITQSKITQSKITQSKAPDG